MRFEQVRRQKEEQTRLRALVSSPGAPTPFTPTHSLTHWACLLTCLPACLPASCGTVALAAGGPSSLSSPWSGDHDTRIMQDVLASLNKDSTCVPAPHRPALPPWPSLTHPLVPPPSATVALASFWLAGPWPMTRTCLPSPAEGRCRPSTRPTPRPPPSPRRPPQQPQGPCPPQQQPLAPRPRS